MGATAAARLPIFLIMIRALVLALAALAVALLPAPRAVRMGFAGVLLVLAVVVGFAVEQQRWQREEDQATGLVEEATHWEEPAPGAFRIAGWRLSAPLRFSDRWAVDATFDIAPAATDPFTGIAIRAVAHDCPDATTPAPACPVLGEAVSRRSFGDLGHAATRNVRLRFVYPGAPFPAGQLRLEPSIEAIRR